MREERIGPTLKMQEENRTKQEDKSIFQGQDEALFIPVDPVDDFYVFPLNF